MDLGNLRRRAAYYLLGLLRGRGAWREIVIDPGATIVLEDGTLITALLEPRQGLPTFGTWKADEAVSPQAASSSSNALWK